MLSLCSVLCVPLLCSINNNPLTVMCHIAYPVSTLLMAQPTGYGPGHRMGHRETKTAAKSHRRPCAGAKRFVSYMRYFSINGPKRRNEKNVNTPPPLLALFICCQFNRSLVVEKRGSVKTRRWVIRLYRYAIGS